MVADLGFECSAYLAHQVGARRPLGEVDDCARGAVAVSRSFATPTGTAHAASYKAPPWSGRYTGAPSAPATP